MAKKKQKKEKDKFEYSNEIIGVILILLSIIGMLGYGRAGNFIRSFAVFLVGVVWFYFLLIFFYCHSYSNFIPNGVPSRNSNLSKTKE